MRASVVGIALAIFGSTLTSTTQSVAQCCAITGRVISAGNQTSITGAMVEAFAIPPRKQADSMLAKSACSSGLTDADGQFIIPNLLPDESYLLRTKCLAYIAHDTIVTVRAYDETVVLIAAEPCVESWEDGWGIIRPGPLVIKPGKSAIIGRVRDQSTGEPIPSAEITLESDYRGDDCHRHRWCCTTALLDSSGRFVLNDLFPGKHTLSPSARGFKGNVYVVDALADSVYTVKFEMVKN